jgi:hypothetical protein
MAASNVNPQGYSWVLPSTLSNFLYPDNKAEREKILAQAVMDEIPDNVKEKIVKYLNTKDTTIWGNIKRYLDHRYEAIHKTKLPSLVRLHKYYEEDIDERKDPYPAMEHMWHFLESRMPEKDQSLRPCEPQPAPVPALAQPPPVPAPIPQ